MNKIPRINYYWIIIYSVALTLVELVFDFKLNNKVELLDIAGNILNLLLILISFGLLMQIRIINSRSIVIKIFVWLSFFMVLKFIFESLLFSGYYLYSGRELNNFWMVYKFFYWPEAWKGLLVSSFNVIYMFIHFKFIYPRSLNSRS